MGPGAGLAGRWDVLALGGAQEYRRHPQHHKRHRDFPKEHKIEDTADLGVEIVSYTMLPNDCVLYQFKATNMTLTHEEGSCLQNGKQGNVFKSHGMDLLKPWKVVFVYL